MQAPVDLRSLLQIGTMLKDILVSSLDPALAPQPVALVIPAYEPGPGLPCLISELAPRWRGPIVVVDDGSTSAQAHKAFGDLHELGIPNLTLLTHDHNLGKGAALKTAFAYLTDAATSRPVNLVPGGPYEQARAQAGAQSFPQADAPQPDKAAARLRAHLAPQVGAPEPGQARATHAALVGIVTADADGQHLAADICAVAAALRAHPDTLVLGTRDFGQPGIPARSEAGNRAMRTAMRVFCGLSVHDTQTGLRGIPLPFAQLIAHMHGNGYEYETTTLIEAAHRGVPFLEVPIATVYEEGNAASHFRPVADSLKITAVLLASFAKYALSSVSASLVDWLAFAAFMAVLPAGVLAGFTITAATLLARIVSALFNFTVNRKVVFKSQTRTRRSAARYAALCVCSACASAALVTGLSHVLPLPAIAIKPLVDTALFFVNYRIQQSWVFR